MQGFVPTLERNADRRALLSKNAGIFESNVEPPEFCDRQVNKRLRELFIADITRERDTFASIARNIINEVVEFGFPSSSDNNFRA